MSLKNRCERVSEFERPCEQNNPGGYFVHRSQSNTEYMSARFMFRLDIEISSRATLARDPVPSLDSMEHPPRRGTSAKPRRHTARILICIARDDEHRWRARCSPRKAIVTRRTAGSDDGRKLKRHAARRRISRRDGNVTCSETSPKQQLYRWPRRYRGKTKQASI